MDKECVIWDIDGTLLDTTEGIISSVKYVIETLKLTRLSDDELLGFVGPKMHDSLNQYFGLTGERLQNAVDLFRDRYKSKDLFKAKMYSKILDVFEELKRNNFRMAIATNKREDYAIKLCQYFGLDKYVEFIHGTDNFNKLKKSELIQKCIEELKVDKEKIVYIGDTQSDKIASENVGIDFIGVNYGYGFKNNKECLNSPIEILEKLFN